MKHLSRARLTNTVGKIFFFLAVLFAIYEYALGVTNIGVNPTLVTSGFVGGSVALVLALFGAFLFHQLAAVFLTFYEEELKKAEEAFEGEDGVSAAFCREILAYSPGQLRLIIDEQKDEYSEAEFAYIQKILARKTQR